MMPKSSSKLKNASTIQAEDFEPQTESQTTDISTSDPNGETQEDGPKKRAQSVEWDETQFDEGSSQIMASEN